MRIDRVFYVKINVENVKQYRRRGINNFRKTSRPNIEIITSPKRDIFTANLAKMLLSKLCKMTIKNKKWFCYFLFVGLHKLLTINYYRI